MAGCDVASPNPGIVVLEGLVSIGQRWEDADLTFGGDHSDDDIVNKRDARAWRS